MIGAHIPAGDNGQSLGYGYVRMESEEEAIAAVKAVDGTQIENRPIQVVLCSITPFVVEVQRVLANNTGKAFCDLCLMRYAPTSPVMPIPVLLDLLFRHFPVSHPGRCADCGHSTLVISAKTALGIVNEPRGDGPAF